MQVTDFARCVHKLEWVYSDWCDVFVSRRLIRFRRKPTIRHPTTRVVTPLQGLGFFSILLSRGLHPGLGCGALSGLLSGIITFTLCLERETCLEMCICSLCRL